MPFAYGTGRSSLRVILRTPRNSVTGGKVLYNDRYAWQGDDYEPLQHAAELRRYALDGDLEYWAADLDLHPPRFRYRFGIETGDGLRWLGADGLRDTPVPRYAFEFDYIGEADLPDIPDWARGATFYHIFPDRFARSGSGHRRGPVDPWDQPVGPKSVLGGDLDGIVERLDHIASLSVDALYLTPIFSSPSNHKYDTADYFTVDADFGGNAALRRLVSALHERGMRLVLDGVFNHAGGEWPPMVDYRRRGSDSPYANWFYATDDEIGYETWGPKLPWMPKLRTREPEVRDYVCRVGRFWLQEFGVDGWRLDVAKEVDHATWRAFRSAVRGVDPEAFLIGEVWTTGLPWLRGEQFDSVMNYPWREAILDFAGSAAHDGMAFLDVVDRIRAAYPEAYLDVLYNLIGSHDEDRPLASLGEDKAAVALAATLLFALPGIASVYYGDEVGMSGRGGHGNRNGMIWDEASQDLRLLQLYQRLGRLRRDSAALRRGGYERLAAEGSLAAFARQHGDDRIVFVANPSRETLSVTREQFREWIGSRGRVLDTFAYGAGQAERVRGTMSLPAQSVALLAGPATRKSSGGNG
jgi:cyclomaltodextrinase / maltogenic alpha-amylase / neopullulanase